MNCKEYLLLIFSKNILSKFGINDADDYGTFFSYIMEKSSAKPLTSAEKQKTNITTIRRLIAMSKVPITINKVKQLLKNNAKQTCLTKYGFEYRNRITICCESICSATSTNSCYDVGQ